MISNDFVIDLATWGLSLEKARAQIAADNIANANTTGISKQIEFKSLLESVSSAVDNNNLSQASALMKQEFNIGTSKNGSLDSVALDAQVADLSSAQGRYKAIAEALTRKFGLMAIAVKGR